MRRRSTVLLAALMALVMFGTDLMLSTDTVPTAAAASPKLDPIPAGATYITESLGNSPYSTEEQIRQAEAKRRDHPQGEALNHLAEDGEHLAVTESGSPRLADNPSSITAIDPVTWAECEDHINDHGEDGYWYKNKYNLCRIVRLTLHYFEQVNGVPTEVGDTELTVELKGTAVNGQSSINFDMRMLDFEDTRRTHKEWPLSIQLPCTNADPARTSDCTEQSGNTTIFRKTVLEWEALAGTEFSWTKITATTAVPPGKYHNEMRGFFEVGLYKVLESPLTGPDVVADPPAMARCDTATYVNGSKCVFANVASVLQFRASDPTLSESAQFIRDAQTDITLTKPGAPGKKVPGVIGDRPLHRLYSGYDFNNDIKASRRRVPKTCRLYWGPKYTASRTKQCDEYPFATTYENAARIDTHTVYDYAVRAIKKEHNETAGRVYGAWLGADRILDGDPFFVRIVP